MGCGDRHEHHHRHHHGGHHDRQECRCEERCGCESKRDCECESGSECRCQQERGACECGCSCCGDGGFRRRYKTKAEQIAELESYLGELKAEVSAAEERLAELRG
jgi:hypothetical protein